MTRLKSTTRRVTTMAFLALVLMTTARPVSAGLLSREFVFKPGVKLEMVSDLFLD